MARQKTTGRAGASRRVSDGCASVGRVSVMARYDFRCRTCGSTFEVERPMAQASDPATCPEGHRDTVKLLSMVSIGGRAAPGASAQPPVPMSGGGCCGGACHA